VRSLRLAAALAVALLGAVPSRADLTDPTRPAVARARRAVAQPAGALTLQSVLLTEGHRVAVINGRRVEAGDRIGGATVVEVGLDGVRLRRRGNEVLLTLFGRAVKRPSPEKEGAR